MNQTNLTGSSAINNNLTVVGNTFTNIIVDSGIYADNITLKSTGGAIFRNVTLSNNAFTNIGQAGYKLMYLNIPPTT